MQITRNSIDIRQATADRSTGDVFLAAAACGRRQLHERRGCLERHERPTMPEALEHDAGQFRKSAALRRSASHA